MRSGVTRGYFQGQDTIQNDGVGIVGIHESEEAVGHLNSARITAEKDGVFRFPNFDSSFQVHYVQEPLLQYRLNLLSMKTVKSAFQKSFTVLD